MYIIKAEQKQIGKIVGMSVRAFETDKFVGGKEGDCPPDYDSVEWHRKMAEDGCLYQAVTDGKIVGAAVLFPDENNRSLYVGRIFIDSIYHRKGYGMQLMECVENEFPYVREFDLDTPSWNMRTNAFYEKAGYTRVCEKDGFVFYKKER